MVNEMVEEAVAESKVGRAAMRVIGMAIPGPSLRAARPVSPPIRP
jgi:hypothetical protein